MRILHLEDSDEDAELIRHLITARWPKASIERVYTRSAFQEQLSKRVPDVVISDYHLPEFLDLDALYLVRQQHPDTPFIFCSGTIGEERAIEAMRAGATDYVLKERLNRLIPALERVERDNAGREARETAENTVQLLISLLEHTTDLVSVCNPQWECIYLNSAGRKMLELGNDESADLLHFVPEAERANYRDTLLDAIHRDGRWSGEVSFCSKSGREIPVSQVVVGHRNRAGTFTHYSTIVRDVSEMHDAHRRLHEQTEAITQAKDGIVISNTEGRVTFWNKGAEAILGWSADEAGGKDVGDFLGDGALPEPDGETNGSSSARKEFVVSHRDGHAIPIDLRAHAILNKEGQTKARLFTFTDLTLQKSLQEQLLRAQRLESLGLLASGISHDLNNILAPILMSAPLLRRQTTDEAGVGLIDMLERSAQRGAELVQQILSFARGVSGEAHLLQLKHILKEVCSIVERTFPKSIEVVYEFDPDLPAIEANPTQMHQLLLNLCVNARDAMPEGGTLKIKAFSHRNIEALASERQVVVEVSDTGTGIAPDVLERMWEPFYTTKEPGKSTGLGLSTVRGIVQNHRGTIHCQSELGVGTTFRIQFPAASLADFGEGAQRSDLPRGNDELILVIDDEKPIADTVSALLRSYGYRTLVAVEATAAIELGAHHAGKIRLVLTDFSMPQIDGGALTGVFRKLIPGIKVIISSGHLSPVSFSGKSSPPDRFITKPYTENVLIRAVHEVLNETNGVPTSA